ncbi:MAG TPA: hypothetical protein VK272_09130 [Solirubrobacteraceae bacterium]|nr:hypothetical protein [Solirubrobacteraceae bacterium]
MTAAVLACTLTVCAHAVPANAAPGFGEIKGPGGCLQESGRPGDSECAKGDGLLHPAAIAVSPDGTSVYVVGGVSGSGIADSFGSVAVLKRDPTTGEVSDLGCLSSDGSDGRDGASGVCTTSPSLLGADGVTVSADGRVVFIASHESASVTAFARDPATGALTRLGCLQSSPHPGSPCTPANIFNGSSELITSPDDSALYLASPGEGTLSAVIAPPALTPSSASAAAEAGAASSAGLAALFTPAPGPFRDNPCVAVNGYDGSCSVGVAMKGVGPLTLSPDGKQLYAVANESQAVDVFAASGGEPLAETSCLKTAAPTGLCSSSALLSDPRQVAISPDGRSVYVADSSHRGGQIDVLARDAATGRLADDGCIDFLPEPVKPEPGAEESETEKDTEKVAEPADLCQSVPGLESVQMLAVSGDGSSVWAFGPGSAVSFSRDPTTGKLTETACASSSDTRCAKLADLEAFSAAAVSPDGRNVYIATGNARALVAFGVGAAVTAASASANSAGVAHVGVACPGQLTRPCHGRLVLTRRSRMISRRGGRGHAWRIAAGGSGFFTIAAGDRAEIAIRLDGSTRGLLLNRRRLHVTATVRADPLAGGSGLGRRLVLRLARR